MSTLTTELLPARTPAVAAAAGFLAIATFQAALALGAPLGRAAWGGPTCSSRWAFASRARSPSGSGCSRR